MDWAAALKNVGGGCFYAFMFGGVFCVFPGFSVFILKYEDLCVWGGGAIIERVIITYM